MSIRPIIRLGHPALRDPAKPVELERLVEPELQTLIDDLFETMHDAGGVGLAAVQIAVGLQLFVYAAVDPDAERTSSPELKVLVNPMVEPEAGELIYDWEGCLSIPDLRGLVPRHPAVRVYGFDRLGEPLKYRAEGYEARIVQHEFDHLNGVTFLDRMRDLRSLAFTDEWETYMTADDDEDIAVG